MIRILRPLGLALLAFLFGLLPALRLTPEPLPFVALTLVLTVAGLTGLRRRWGAAAESALLLAGFAAAGAAAGSFAAVAAERDCRGWIPDGATVRAVGVLGAGIVGQGGPGLSRPAILPLEHAVVTTRAGVECQGAIRIRPGAEELPAPAGTRVEVTGEWVRAGGRVVPDAWPAEPFFSGFLIADGVRRVEGDVPATPLLGMRGATESAIRALFPGHAPLAEALLLGRRERLDPAISERFARSGLIHLLAISGSHVGLFAAMLLILGTAARLSRTRVAWLCILIVAVYLAMIGAPASAVRSGIMLSLALLAVVLQRPAAAVPLMAAAALVILAWSPATVLDAGFQLSFAGVIGIVVARRAVLDAMPGRLLRRPLVRPLVESVTISVAAFIATAPFVAHHFGQIAPIAILANLVAAPAMALALCGVVGAVAIYPLAPPLARLIADGASVALDLLDRTATLAAGIPLGHLQVPRPDWLAWLAAAAVAWVAWRAAAASRAPVRRGVAAGTTVALLIAWPALVRGDRGALEIHFLDVGQGDAIAIRTPADRWILVDAGPRSATYDAGARRVLPFLHAHRVARLEALILTHPDLDHVGGAPAVLRALAVGAVIEPGLAVGKEVYAELLGVVAERGIPWRAARAGQRVMIDGVELSFLWPDSTFLDAKAEANQISAVVLVRFGDFEALLTGDISQEVERRLVALHGTGLRAEVLKAGHHGSATSTGPELLAAVGPELTVITVGRRNRYGHPSPDVMRRLEGFGIRIARTDRDGTVTVRASAGPGGRWTRVEP